MLPRLDTTPDPRVGAGILKQDRLDEPGPGFAVVLSSVVAGQASASASPEYEASSPPKTGSTRQAAESAPGLPDGRPDSAVDASAVSLAAAIVGMAPSRTEGGDAALGVGSGPTQVPKRADLIGSSAPSLRDLVQGLGAGSAVATPASVGAASLTSMSLADGVGASEPLLPQPPRGAPMADNASPAAGPVQSPPSAMPRAASSSAPEEKSEPAAADPKARQAARAASVPPRSRRDTATEEMAGVVASASVTSIIPAQQALASPPSALPTATSEPAMASADLAGSPASAASALPSTKPRRPAAEDGALLSVNTFAVASQAVRKLQATPAINPPVAAAHGNPPGASSLSQVVGSLASPVVPAPEAPMAADGAEARAGPVLVGLTNVVVTTAIAPAVQGDFARRLASRDPTAVPTAIGAGEVQAAGVALASGERAVGSAASAGIIMAGPGRASIETPVEPKDPVIAPAIAGPSAESREVSKRRIDPQPLAAEPRFAQTATTGDVPFQPAIGAMPTSIAAIVESAVALAEAPDQPAGDIGGTPNTTPAKTMTLQLSYGDLGTIAVQMHLVGQTLDVQLSAADARTASLIDRDRDALSGALRDQQFDLRSLVIQGHANRPPGEIHAPANDSASDGSPPGAGSDASGSAYGGPSTGSGGFARGGPAAPERRNADAADPAPGAGVGARSRALYV